MFDPRRPTPAGKKTRTSSGTRTSSSDARRKNRKSRTVVPSMRAEPDDEVAGTLLDKAGIDELFQTPDGFAPDRVEEPRKKRPRRIAELEEEEEVVVADEPMVADKDGTAGVRQFFIEEAVVVDRGDPPRPLPTPPPTVTIEPAPIVQVPSPPPETDKPTRRRRKRRQEEIAVVAPVEALRPLPQATISKARPRTRAFFPATAAVLLLIVAFLLYVLGRQQVESRARTDLEKVAGEFIVAFTTFNHGSIGQQSDKVKELSVGGFREDYLGFVNDESYRKFLTDLQGNSSGKVLSMAVDDIREDQAKVIAFVDVTTVNKDRPEPQVVANRFELTLVRTPQGWKVDDVAFL